MLPRDDRVLRDAPPDRIFEALVGVPLDTASLRTVVTGCGFSDAAPEASSARLFSNGWVMAPSGNGAVYLRRAGSAWTLAAATRGPFTVMYEDQADGRPSTIRLRAEDQGRVTADLTLRLSDVETNRTLDPRTFDIGPDLPAHPVPITVDELRRLGPLGG